MRKGMLLVRGNTLLMSNKCAVNFPVSCIESAIGGPLFFARGLPEWISGSELRMYRVVGIVLLTTGI